MSAIAHARSRRACVLRLLSTLALAVAGCQRSAPSAAPSAAPAVRYHPAHDLGPLFHDVQMAALFADSKTFVDARALQPPPEIAERCAAEKGRAGFSLGACLAPRRCDTWMRSRPSAFWMDGATGLAGGTAYRRVVRLRDATVLNRLFDDIAEPRPESYRQDYALAQTVPPARRPALYRNLRASAESGWDFSSRWMRDPRDLRTPEMIEPVPVDLNSSMYHTEQTIAGLRRLRGQAGDAEVAARFAGAAVSRRRALLSAAYDPERGFFYDVRWRTGERVTDRPTLAAPLHFGLASPEQGRAVAARLEHDFLEPGGFVTTLIVTGQQWDAPNEWPSLEWLSIEGLRRYGRGDLADLARERWLALNRRTYRSTGKTTEKYNVVDLDRRGGGGEYPTQDGFGWSNGVALALAAQERSAATRPASRTGQQH